MPRIVLPILLLLGAGLAAQEEKGPSLDTLLKQYREATDVKTKRKLIDILFARGEEVFRRVAELARGDKKMAELRDALDMRLVVAAFEELEKKFPGQSLVFAGQFEGMKKYGQRAVRGALLLMKDYTLFPERYRNRAWEVLADVGDKSVIPELRKLSEDFLVEDAIQLGAAYAMAALGDTSAIDKKIQEYRERIQDEPERRVQYLLDIASIYYHGRQYDKALEIYAGLIKVYERTLAERGREMAKEEKEQLQNLLALMSYNAACNASLKGDVKAAYRYLAKAIRNDQERTYLKSLLRDGDLKKLRADPGFKGWYEKAKAGALPPESGGGKEKDKAGKEKKAAGAAEGKAGVEPVDLPPPTPAERTRARRMVQVYLEAPPKAAAALWGHLVKLRHAVLPHLEERLERNPKDRAARELYGRLCATLVLDVFRRTEAAHPEGPLTFAGQFAGLKGYGRRAAVGALHILKDSEQKMQYRGWAGDALGDLGQKWVVPELKKIATDFLYDDAVQEAAAYALAALGEPAVLEEKIQALREELAESRDAVALRVKMARMYYRGRRYAAAAEIYRRLTARTEGLLRERAEELPPEEQQRWAQALAGWYYSLACSLALQGKIDEAFRALEGCARYDRKKKLIRSVARDGDLRALRRDPRFAAWYARLRGGA